MNIRSFRKEDAEKVSKLICKTLKEVNIKDYPKGVIDKLCQKYSTQGVEKLSQERDFFVLLDNSKIVGVGSLYRNIVYTVFIDPDVHGKGLGTKIMKYFEETIKQRGFQTVELPSSLTASGFYKKLGYTKIKETNEHGVTEIIMQKVFKTEN